MPTDYEAITRYNEKQLGKDTASRKSQVNMYSDFSHFVYEILQNADDYAATTVTFKLNNNELVVEHNGIPFEEENVKAISYFGKSTSRDDLIKTGRFGLGFKSVFAFTASPVIHSGEENFEIYSLYRLKALLSPHDLIPEKTRIRLPFNHMDKRPDYVETLVTKEKAFEQISYRLRNLDITTLLFTRNILEIKWNVQDKEGNYDEGHYLREDRFKKKVNEHLQTTKTEITDGDNLHTYLVFSRPIKWQGDDHKPVDVAFFLDDHGESEVIRTSKKPLFVLFPTTVETHMGFLMNGPFRTPAHRETVSQGDEFNQFLIEEIASLLGQSLLDIRERGFLSGSFLETLPIRMDDFPSDGMFYPIVEAIRDAFIEQKLLPADDGTFISAKNAKLASADWLRKLLREKHLKDLFQRQSSLKWISEKITERRTHDLWKYLQEQLDIEEVTPDSFARKINESFLKNRSNQWFVSFYRFLNDQNVLWKVDTTRYRPRPGPLRNRPFIRLQDGTHVPPFDKDGSPNAYLPFEGETEFPVVASEIVKDVLALEFLNNLGLDKPDTVAEVMDKVLPKYSQDTTNISVVEHQRDMAKLLDAYSTWTYSPEKKRLLLNKLKETAFIYAENPTLKQKSFKMPGELYFKNNDLLMYFKGNDDTWFISEYDDSFQTFFTKLGVTESIRIHCESKNGYTEVVLRCSHGYRRGLKGFDPDIGIDGLKHALLNPTANKSSFIWNNLAIRYERCIRGIVLKSSRKDFSRKASTYKQEELVSPQFGKLLIESTWLPDLDGYFHRPNEVGLYDLPEIFQRDEKLSEQLGMKKNVVAKLAEIAGISQDTLSLAQTLERQPPDIRKKIESMLQKESSQPEFPKKTSANPERRKEKIIKKYKDAPKKKYEKTKRSRRTTENIIDPQNWLRETYTNDNREMICQICEKAMPFRKKNGQYYFEAVEILNHLDKELEELHLALCPLCAAMYKEFVKRDEDATERLKDDLIATDNLKIPVKLGDREASLHFVETHSNDLKVILRELGDKVD